VPKWEPCKAYKVGDCVFCTGSVEPEDWAKTYTGWEAYTAVVPLPMPVGWLPANGENFDKRYDLPEAAEYEVPAIPDSVFVSTPHPTHEDSGAECLVAHYGSDGRLLPQCKRCRVCGFWVRPEHMTRACFGKRKG
jgi:hypothetical protein